MDVIIPARNFVLVYITYILTHRLPEKQIIKIFQHSLIIICSIYTMYMMQTVYFLITGKVSILNFLYDYDLGRVKAFYENGTTSVVIGSLLSVLFTLTLCSKLLKYRKLLLFVLFILGTFTASRANILSNIMALVVYHSMTKSQFSVSWAMRTIALSVVCLAGLYIIMLKIILAGVNIDGSALTRLNFYMIALESAQSIRDLFLGHGFSEEALHTKFGISFFESYFFNFYMQAGLIGLFSAVYIIFRIVLIYNLPKRDTSTILSGILVANLIGGANLFSIFVLPFLLLGLRATATNGRLQCKKYI
jgi:hypothetical protein